MDASIIVAAPPIRLPDPPSATGGGSELADLLRQTLEVQKDQLAVLRTQAAAMDGLARWRAFLNRWEGDYPGIGAACKQTLPAVERAYLGLIRELTERVKDSGSDLDDEFALGEFLDRYGMRLNQLGTILSQLGTLADAAPAESTQ
jgi:hypothetical protein